MSSTNRFLRLVAFPGLFVALACASTPSPPEPEELESQRPLAATTNAPEPVAKPQISLPNFAPVYFDTDHAQLRPDARNALKQYATQILDHPEWGVLTIGGHCDERGSEQYNLALGERRALAVMRYLVDQGVPRSRLASRSFGEARPVIAGHDESTWQLNRRSELQLEAVESTRR